MYKVVLYVASDIDEGDTSGGSLRASTQALFVSGPYVSEPTLSIVHWYQGHSQALITTNGCCTRRICIEGRFGACVLWFYLCRFDVS